MTPPLVSVLMPVFNAAATVVRAVESIRCQTLTDWELLAVDDGSTDDTPAHLAELAAQDHRVRRISIGHAGIVPALNAGLAVARGEFVARMDADDVAHPERLGEQVTFLQRHPAVGLVGGQVEFGGDAAAQAGYALHVAWLNSLVTEADLGLNRFVESPFAHPSVVFRRTLAERHGGYRAGDFPEDYELWLRWWEAGVRMAKVPRVLLTWHDRPQRLSRIDPRYELEAFYRCKAGYLARWLERHVDRARTILVWGAGRPTRRRAELLATHGVAFAGYVDIDPRKIGQCFQSRPVIAPEALPAANRPFVLGYVAKRGARELIRSSLRDRGYVEGRDFLMAA